MLRRRDIQRFVRSTNTQLYETWKPIIKDLFDKSILAHRGDYPPLKLQAELVGHIIAADQRRKEYVRGIERFSKALRRLVELKAPTERIKLAQRRVEDWHRYTMSADLAIGQLRSIGDGIAWRFLGYNRAALRLLAEHDYVSPPQLGIGLLEELNVLQRLADEGYDVLLNAITNYLRVGDVTTFDKESGRFELVEVKAGTRRNRRIIRQDKHMALVQEGLDGETHQVSGVPITRIVCDAPLITHARSVENAMAEAEQEFGSSRLFGDYLSVAVFAIAKYRDRLSSDTTDELRKHVLERCMSVVKNDKDLTLPPMSNILHTVRFSPILAPYAVFPIDIQRRFELLSGDYFVISMLNVGGLARWLKKRGWETRVVELPKTMPAKNQFPHVPVLEVRKGHRGTQIGLDILLIAAMEFWMPESIERLVAAICNKELPQEGFYTVDFPHLGKYAWD